MVNYHGQFSYEYKNEVNVPGRKLIHIGGRHFMFESPFVSEALGLEQFMKNLRITAAIFSLLRRIYMDKNICRLMGQNIFCKNRERNLRAETYCQKIINMV